MSDGRLIVSPTDLVGFLDCAHLTQLELLALRGLLERPVREDAMLDMLADKGRAHEAAVLEQLRSDRPRVVTIADHGRSVAGLEEAAAETLAVMRGGADVIYQAAFFDGTAACRGAGGCAACKRVSSVLDPPTVDVLVDAVDDPPG